MFGAIFGAVTGLLGGIFGSRSKAKEKKAELEAQSKHYAEKAKDMAFQSAANKIQGEMNFKAGIYNHKLISIFGARTTTALLFNMKAEVSEAKMGFINSGLGLNGSPMFSIAEAWNSGSSALEEHILRTNIALKQSETSVLRDMLTSGVQGQALDIKGRKNASQANDLKSQANKVDTSFFGAVKSNLGNIAASGIGIAGQFAASGLNDAMKKEIAGLDKESKTYAQDRADIENSYKSKIDSSNANYAAFQTGANNLGNLFK